MIYIVTGDGPRCGSTMMMRALQAGGLELGGFYDELCELPVAVQLTGGFPGEEYAGKALKVWAPPWGPLTHLVSGDYKIVWLHRDSTARWKSLLEFHKDTPLGMMTSGSFGEIAKLKDMAVQASTYALTTRQDMDVVGLDYEGVLKEPLKAFELLVRRDWPIDPVKAAEVPDPAKRRF